MRLIVIFVVLLGAAGIAVWPRDNAQEGARIAPQSWDERAAPNAAPATLAGAVGLQSDTHLQATQNADTAAIHSTPLVSDQSDLSKAIMEAHRNVQNPHVIQDPFKQAMEESKQKNSTALISPFGSRK
jgi:hypothetical protein